MDLQKKTHENNNLWLCPTTEDKEIKIFTAQQNQSFCYGKQIHFLGAVIGCIL